MISYPQWVKAIVTTSLHTRVFVASPEATGRLGHDTGLQLTPKKGENHREKQRENKTKKESAH
jgi:hypothetical protein